MPGQTDYLDGTYFRQNPDWHVRDSPWKVRQILRLLNRNQIVPKTIYEAGCGAGEVLRLLQQNLDPTCELWGVDISAQAIETVSEQMKGCISRCSKVSHARENFSNWRWRSGWAAHVEDYRGFLRKLKSQATYKLIHIPLGHFGAARSSGEKYDPASATAPASSLFF